MEQRTTKWYQDMDKVAKIRAEIERLKKCSEYAKMEWIPAGYNQNAFAEDCRIASFNKLISFIDSMQEEPVKIKKGCKYRSICNVTNNDTGNISFVAGKIYLAPEDDTLVSEENGWLCDTSEDSSNFELVEEPVSEEFEEAANNALERMLDKYGLVGTGSCLEMFKLGAEWQKTKDESCSKDLGEYINELSKQFPEVSFAKLSRIAVRVAKWQKENLWKPADGDNLPEIDKEVAAFQETFPTDVDVPSLLKIVIAHRPNPEGYDGKSIATGKVDHYTPKTYDKGGWNIPDVKFLLDVELPKEIEL